MNQYNSSDELEDLPRYLQRYLKTRHAHMVFQGEEEKASFLSFALEQRQEVGLRYLRETAERLKLRTFPLEELLETLGRIEQCSEPSLLVGELVKRIEECSQEEVDKIANTLMILDTGDYTPAGRLVIDRAVQRIVPKLNSVSSRELAVKLVVSKRVNRRRAAYKFFRLRGLDDRSRALLVSQLDHDALEAPDLVACDTELVQQLGLGRVLDMASSTYYRMRAIQCAMEFQPPSEIMLACSEYPQEIVWAVFEKHQKEYLPYMMRLLDEYRSDAYLLNRILGCIGKIGGSDEIIEALETVTGKLDNAVGLECS
ncbi:hypothetical protein [Amycolatopsis taiwanensis]|uniref:hypothetical protein n=1 Tax=Amycolatopsis taiwanensis TaxID=342230 RepID=UPI0012EC0805|nr:hypothetical protein [Amycolatopsis taiwanensis]